MIKSTGAVLLLTFCLPLVSVLQMQEASKPMNRATALTTLKGCATRPITLGCSEDTAGYLIKSYEDGDKALLESLFQAGLTSDGALSEILGDFYAKVLWKNPQEFLEALRSRPREERNTLSRLAAITDGSGMTSDMLRDVRHNLSRIGSQHVRLAPVARDCLIEVNKANAKNH